ncbi:hypothetical protein WJX72_000862 [[Myrmecia] bisecta]|uniref:Uncharacterized protein n=1 Tax=[Myrmecia] bisecta TaxID=41462 RepID=A0AAW1PXI9_9CHLO
MLEAVTESRRVAAAAAAQEKTKREQADTDRAAAAAQPDKDRAALAEQADKDRAAAAAQADKDRAAAQADKDRAAAQADKDRAAAVALAHDNAEQAVAEAVAEIRKGDSWHQSHKAPCELVVAHVGLQSTRRLMAAAGKWFVKKIIIAAAESTMNRLRISKAAFDLVHTLGINDNGIVNVLRRHSTRTVHTVNMTQLGPDLQAVPPSTDLMFAWEFKAVARWGCARCINLSWDIVIPRRKILSV